MDAYESPEVLFPEPDILRAVRSQLLDSSFEFDHALADYLANYDTTYSSFSPLMVLGSVTQPIRLSPSDKTTSSVEYFLFHSRKDHSFKKSAKLLGAAFIKDFLLDIRATLCGAKKGHGKVGDKTHAAIAVLGSAVAHKLGVQDSTAIGLAVLILLSLAKASKKAFCKVTDKEVLEAPANED